MKKGGSEDPPFLIGGSKDPPYLIGSKDPPYRLITTVPSSSVLLRM